MKLLLDTCTFLWIAQDSSELSQSAREVFADPANEVYLSVVSAWEIAVKHALGRLPLPQTPDRYLPQLRERHGIESLALDEEAVMMMSYQRAYQATARLIQTINELMETLAGL